jgi:NADP-dependent 3-hydroxy acid dehydrogenase YdfG
VTDAASIAAAVKQVGVLGILVNNAGISLDDKSPDQQDADEFRQGI